MEKFDGPDTRFDDFHLCPDCMREFTDFVKAGKQDVK
jgi:hydrogenase maturation factor HypF (carbamoyltransferase family)